jgi:hypothetical protein
MRSAASIAAFVMHYDLSGVLSELSHDPATPLLHGRAIDVLLATTALCHWRAFDNTPQGFGMAVVTATLGPLIEIGLVSPALLADEWYAR